jgi:hypothetical protein
MNHIFKFKIWQFVQNKWPIWYFDATGGILKKVNKQKNVLLYSLVMHDKVNKKICPLADFFTTGHDAENIASYLRLIKNQLEKSITKRNFQYAPVIVTDFSWGIINAIITTFNNCKFETYLNWCASILIKKEIWKLHMMPVIHILCYCRFLKMTADKIKKIKKFSSKKSNRKIQKLAIYCSAILQKSINMIEFGENLKFCFNFFFNTF